MSKKLMGRVSLALAGLVAALAGCRYHMPHALTWPAGGDIVPTHAAPPEGGYYSNWDPYAVELEVTPLDDVNPVRTQHVIIATVKDKNGKPLPNRRVEWILNEGSVGDIVQVDESGWRASRGYKVTPHYAISHTNNFDHVIDRGDNDPSNDIHLKAGQTWCVITSPIEGQTHITVYAPGIYDWNKHKVFATKSWYDVTWKFPPAATNPIGTPHEFVTHVTKYSDGSGLAGYDVIYKIMDGPAATFEQGGGTTATVKTDASGMARVTLRQTSPVEGVNNVQVDIIRPEDVQCCKPPVHIATGMTSKTWVGPKIACNKTASASVLAGDAIDYTITVTNPSQVAAPDIVVTDSLPDGVEYVSSSPQADSAAGQTLTWSLGSIAPGGQKTISIRAKATRSGRFENCAEVRGGYGLQTRCCATTVVVSPKLAIEKTCPPAVTVCDPIDYVITVRNPGDGPANNVTVTDTLPDGITVDGKQTVTVSVGTLAAGESREVRLSAKASRTGRFENRVSASADGGLTADATCTTVVSKPELAVTKTGPATQIIGRPMKFEITVKNTGDSPARNTVLTDPIPANASFDSASDGGQFADGRVTWNLGTLEPNQSRTVSISLRGTGRGTIRNTASATAICADGNAAAETELRGVPAILLECVDDPDPIEVGTTTTYLIEVTNQGTTEDTNTTVVVNLPAELEFVSADGATRGTVSGKTISFAPYPSLAPKQKITYRVIAKGVKEGDVRFRVTLTSDFFKTPIEETESTHVY